MLAGYYHVPLTVLTNQFEADKTCTEVRRNLKLMQAWLFVKRMILHVIFIWCYQCHI